MTFPGCEEAWEHVTCPRPGSAQALCRARGQRRAGLICPSAEDSPRQREGPQESPPWHQDWLPAGTSAGFSTIPTTLFRHVHYSSRVRDIRELQTSFPFHKNESMYSLLLNVRLLCGGELLVCPKLAYLYKRIGKSM